MENNPSDGKMGLREWVTRPKGRRGSRIEKRGTAKHWSSEEGRGGRLVVEKRSTGGQWVKGKDVSDVLAPMSRRSKSSIS